MQKSLLSIALAMLLMCSLSMTACAAEDSSKGGTDVPGQAEASNMAFPDVPEGAWYYEAVQYISANGIMTGTDKGFEPDSPFSRAQVATVFYRMAGAPPVNGTDAFSDTEPDQWYSDAILWADQTGLVQGYGNGLFGVADSVTQEQLVTILWRYAGCPEGTGEAADVAEWYAPAVAWVDGKGLTGSSLGYPFAHAQEASRAQVAAILTAYLTALSEEDTSMGDKLTLSVDGTFVDVAWESNESVDALWELVRSEPLTVQMSMYGGFEQVGSLGTNLPRNDTQTTTSAGDIVLYSGNSIVIFYGSNSWAYTRLGKIQGMSAQELREKLGNGNVTVTLEMK